MLPITIGSMLLCVDMLVAAVDAQPDNRCAVVMLTCTLFCDNFLVQPILMSLVTRSSPIPALLLSSVTKPELLAKLSLQF